MNKKERISIDLDVVTVGLWEKKDSRKEEAVEMLERIKNKEFHVISLSSLIKLPEKWKDKILARKVTDYYFAHTDRHVDDVEIFDKLKRKNVNVNQLLSEFHKGNIKEEDIFLVLSSSLSSSTLITMNRRHLRGNEEVINNILGKFGLKKIKIRYPHELSENHRERSNPLKRFKDSRNTALFISSANLTGSFFAGTKTLSLMNIKRNVGILKLFFILITLSTFIPSVLAHPLSQITPINTNLNILYDTGMVLVVYIFFARLHVFVNSLSMVKQLNFNNLIFKFHRNNSSIITNSKLVEAFSFKMLKKMEWIFFNSVDMFNNSFTNIRREGFKLLKGFVMPFHFPTHFIKALLTLSCEMYSSFGAFLALSNSFNISSLTSPSFSRIKSILPRSAFISSISLCKVLRLVTSLRSLGCFKGSFRISCSLINIKKNLILFKTLLILVISLSLIPSVLAQTQSHPLSQLTPIDTNLNMSLSGTAYNITSISWIAYSGGIVFAGTRGIPTNDIQDSAITSSKIAAAVALTGNVSVDSPTFFVDSSNDRVGIGTTSPNYLLQVASGTDGRSVNLSNVLYVNGSSGNVGIGTTGPLDALQVNSAVTTTHRGNLLLTDSAAIAAGVGGQINFGGKYTGSTLTEWAGIQGTKVNVIDGDYGGNLEFRTRQNANSLATKMIITSTGNVGIGTTSPGSYDSGGDNLVIATSGLTGMTIAAGSSSESGIYLADGTTGSEAYRGYIKYLHSSDSLKIGTAATDRITIDSSGNVGIGRAGPGALLHLNGTHLPNRGQLTIESTIPQITLYSGSTTATDLEAQIYHDGTTFFINNRNNGAYGSLVLNQNSGNVGIGTTGPNDLLEVSGSGAKGIRVTDTSNASTPFVRFFGTGTERGSLFYDIPNSQFIMQATAGSVVFKAGATEYMRITNSGNVGIGTTGPQVKLQLGSDSTSDGIIYSNGLRIYTTNSAAIPVSIVATNGATTQTAFRVVNANEVTEYLTVKGSGNVGIGTTGPAFKLSTADGDTIGTSVLHLSQNYISGVGEAGLYGIELYAVDNGVNGDDLRIRGRTSSAGSFSDLVTVKNSGNVGIGTTNPGEKLEVYNGAVKIFKSVTAPAATWTDIDSDSTYIGAMYTVTVVQDADAANIRTYFVLLSGSASGTTAVVVNSVAAGTSTITASFQGSGSGAGPYKLQINPSVAATAYVGKIVVL